MGELGDSGIKKKKSQEKEEWLTEFSRWPH